MGRKPKSKEEPQVHNELKGLDVQINQFGEIELNLELKELNKFLDERVEDKKFKHLDSVVRKD